jgi:toxin HigB-1
MRVMERREFPSTNAATTRLRSSVLSLFIVKAYRKRIQIIQAATDERDLYAIKGNRFEKLKGDRSHQCSLRLNDKMRLIVEIAEGSPENKIIVIAIENYH